MPVEVQLGALGRLAKDGPIDKAKALKAVLAYLLAESGQAWRNQGYKGGQPWSPRITPNVPALIRALQQGATTWRPRWADARPALVDTGRLRQSITGRINEEENSVEIGTNVEYARLHQDGGTVTMPGMAKGSPLRAKLYALLKTAPAGMRKQLGWLYGVKSVTFKIRKRPVVEITPAMIEDVKGILLKHRIGGESK